MSVKRLEDNSDLMSEEGRGQLNETLYLVSNKLRLIAEDLKKVKEADKIVRPVPITAYPMAAGQVYTGEEGGEIGDITWRAVLETPVGTLLCNGASVSTTTYADLFAKIGYTFGGAGSTFNIPNLQRRTMVGTGGTGTATLANAVGSNGGAETHTLTALEIPEHTHGLASHTHTIAHGHDGLEYSLGTGAGAGPTRIQANQNSQTELDSAINTTGTNTADSGAATGNTNGFGGDDPHNNMQPSLVLAPYIRFRLGPTDTIQTLPISWGGVNGQWRLDTLRNFPVTAHSNLHTVVVTGERPGAVVRITATSGSQSGNSSENKIIGIVALPHSFRKFKTEALKIATKVNMTGCAAATSATITLKVSDPVTAGAYLSETYSRTVNVSAGTIADSAYVDCLLTKEQLGRDWKAGYLLRFEIVWSVPKTFATALLDVGFMEIGWQ